MMRFRRRITKSDMTAPAMSQSTLPKRLDWPGYCEANPLMAILYELVDGYDPKTNQVPFATMREAQRLLGFEVTR